MRARRREIADQELLPLPKEVLTLEVMQAWVDAHHRHAREVHEWAWFTARMSQMFSPGLANRAIAEELRWGYRTRT